MAYNNNIRTIQNNIVVISGSQIQATGSLFGTNISGTIAQFTTITGSTIVSTIELPSFIAINTSSNNTHRLLINQSSQANNGLRVTGQGNTIDLYATLGNAGTLSFTGGQYSIGHDVTSATNGNITSGRFLNFRTFDNASISGFNFQVSSSGAGFNNTVAQITRTGNIYAAGNVTGSLISGSTGQFTAVTASFTGSGAGLFNLTASGISNFTSDVRNQFSAGTNITIVDGVISAAGGTGSGNPDGPDTSVQFNKAGSFSGSNLLTYNYTSNILSGTTAEFTTITGTNISVTKLVASNASAATPSITFNSDQDTGFYWNGSSGDIGVTNNGSRTFVLGTAGMASNLGGGIFLLPGAGNTAAGPAYTFNTDLDTGMYRPAANNIAFTTSGSQRILITDTNVSISGSLIVTGSITGSSLNITGTLSGASSQSIIKSDQGISFRTRDNGTGSFTERMFISTNDTINVYSSLNTTALTASVVTANVVTASVLLTGSTAQFTLISGSTVTGSTAQFTIVSGTHVAPLGSLSTASYTFIGDSNTGIYSPAADTIAFIEGGVEALRISPNGTITSSVPLTGTVGTFTSLTSSFTGSGDGLYNLTASGISNFTNDVRNQFSAGTNVTIVGGVISATGGSGSPGGANQTIQFNSGSTFSGSTNLIYDYTNNILSGTTAQFTILSASNIFIDGEPVAAATSSFLVLTASTNLTNERVLTAGTNITFTDNGPGNTLIIDSTGGGGTFGQLTASFSRSVHSVTSFVSDAGVSLSSNIITTIALSSSRDLDEMELAPVVVAVGGITAGVGFNVIAVSLDGDADGTYLINYTRN